MADYIIAGFIIFFIITGVIVRVFELRQEGRRIKILSNTLDVLVRMHNAEMEKGNEMLKLIAKLKGINNE